MLCEMKKSRSYHFSTVRDVDLAFLHVDSIDQAE